MHLRTKPVLASCYFDYISLNNASWCWLMLFDVVWTMFSLCLKMTDPSKNVTFLSGLVFSTKTCLDKPTAARLWQQAALFVPICSWRCWLGGNWSSRDQSGPNCSVPFRSHFQTLIFVFWMQKLVQSPFLIFKLNWNATDLKTLEYPLLKTGSYTELIPSFSHLCLSISLRNNGNC